MAVLGPAPAGRLLPAKALYQLSAGRPAASSCPFTPRLPAYITDLGITSPALLAVSLAPRHHLGPAFLLVTTFPAVLLLRRGWERVEAEIVALSCCTLNFSIYLIA